MSARTERNICPEEYQRRIAEAGGTNRYDEPNFRICWGQTETFRAGGVWAGEGQPFYRGYRDLLIGLGEPGWILQQWQAPERYGTPTSYYVQNLDVETGYQILGEYPYKGRYETVFPLVHRSFVNGRPVTEHMPLSNYLIDVVVPIVLAYKEISVLRRRALLEDERERERRQREAQIEARLHDALPRLGEIRSSAHLVCNSVIQKKVEQIERHWKQTAAWLRHYPKGLTMVQ